jgi:hypothetical protein
VRGDDPKDPEAGEDTAGQAEAAHGVASDGTVKTDAFKSRQNLAGIGGPKKRKQGRVVGDEVPDKEEETEDRQERKSAANKPKQKKKKKVKLSFDEPEGD